MLAPFRSAREQTFRAPLQDNPLGNIALLRQEGSVDDYCDRFLLLAYRAENLSEGQQIQLFAAGLGQPLRTDVALQRPTSLDDAIMYARAYEKCLALPATVDATPTRTVPRSSYRHSISAAAPATSVVASTASVGTTPAGSKKLSPMEIADRRLKGLCFHCDDKFTQGHRKECKQLFVIEVLCNNYETTPNLLDEPLISLSALTGIQPTSAKTMQVYVDSATAPRVGIPLQQRNGLRVAVANGDRLTCSGVSDHLDIGIGGEPFSITCYGLDLGSHDMVLGVQWLESLGPILWDFSSRTMVFIRRGKRVLWQGTSSGASLAILSSVSPDLMDDLLLAFQPLFAAPTGLPSARECCHRITLKPGTGAIAVRPYRYAHFQKEELERQCAEMLHLGVIRPSSSAFSAPVLLVKKTDGSWRFCVNYRTLNDATGKDKFPISVVEELPDELRGAKFFTKLDLCSGYH